MASTKKKFKRVFKREFLEKEDADSYIKLTAREDVWEDGQSCSLKIADCNRSVSLYFDGREGRMGHQKLAVLRKYLDYVEQVLKGENVGDSKKTKVPKV